MSYNTYTTQDVYDNIVLIAHIPSANATFTQARITTLANRELQTPIMKQILSSRGGYYKFYRDYTAQSQGLYSIPPDCIAGVLDNVELIQGTTIVPVNEIEESEQFSTISPTSTSYGYFLKGNYVQIIPTPNVGSARLWYPKRPSALVSVLASAQVTAISGATITVSTLPTTMQVGTYVDILGDQPPFNFVNENIQIIAVSGTDITLESVPDTTIAIGNWICLNGQTCVPQIPVEYRVLLEQRTVVKIYEIQGYKEKYKAAMDSLKELEEATLNLITPRVKDTTKVIFPVNGGFLANSSNRLSNFPTGRDT